MNCNRTVKYLPEYLGGELGGRKSEAVKKHLLLCADCLRQMREYKQSFGALDTLKDETIGEEAWLGFNTRVRVAIENTAVGPRRVPALRLGAAGLVCAGLVLAILFATGAFRPEPEKAPGNGVVERETAPKPKEDPSDTASEDETYVEEYPYWLEEVTTLAGRGEEL